MKKSLLFWILSLSTLGICFSQYQIKNALPKKERVKYTIRAFEPDTSFLKSLSLSSELVDPAAAFLFFEHYRDSLDTINSQIKNLLEIQAQNEADLDNLNNQILELRQKQIKVEAAKEYFYNINRFSGTPKWYNSIFPLRTRSGTDFYYENIDEDNFEFFQDILLQGGEGKSVFSTEVVTGYFSLFRINLSTVIYNGSDDTEGDSEKDNSEVLLNKIYSGGGLVTTNIDYPIFFRRFTESVLLLNWNLRGSADFDAIGNDLPKDEFIGYAEPSLTFFGEVRLRKSEVRLFGSFKYGIIFASDALDDVVGNENHNSFDMAQTVVGVNFMNKFKISANIPLLSVEGAGGADNYLIGVQYIPGKTK